MSKKQPRRRILVDDVRYEIVAEEADYSGYARDRDGAPIVLWYWVVYA